MNKPNINPKHDYFEYWKPVRSGLIDPDEWQSELMKIVEDAENKGVFYSSDMMEWVKNHNDFIPVEWWDYQYTSHKVEGGIMGMEVYSARCALRDKREREENEKALKNINIDELLGSLCVNGKRINKCVVRSISEYNVTITGVAGRYGCKFTAQAKNISNMIDKAKEKGWRK